LQVPAPVQPSGTLVVVPETVACPTDGVPDPVPGEAVVAVIVTASAL
jgi:hypothetical protein